MADDKSKDEKEAPEGSQSVTETSPSEGESPEAEETPPSEGQSPEAEETLPSEGQSPEDEDLGIDDDLADALSEGADQSVEVESLIESMDPGFSDELNEISSGDFAGVMINKEIVSDEVDESAKAPSAYKAFVANIPTDLKNRYILVAGILVVMLPLAALIYMGKLLPRFEIPYKVSMDEISKEVIVYDTTDPEIPLFDQYRNRGFTVSLPRTMINLKVDGDRPAYAQFEFKFSLRDEEYIEIIKKRESEISDLMQGVLAEITLRELQTPMGKEKVKKVIRHRVNTFLKGNFVLGVYYHTILVDK